MLTNIKYFEISFVFWLQKSCPDRYTGHKKFMSSNACMENKPVEKPEYIMIAASLN